LYHRPFGLISLELISILKTDYSERFSCVSRKWILKSAIRLYGATEASI